MALVLHRFPLSHFSEKACATLDFKGLDYRIVDHAPGPDQLALYRLSGQRKVPVLEHDGEVIVDSTSIALHLDRAFPAGEGRRALLPADIPRRRAVLDLEDRIDDVLGRCAPIVGFGYAVRDRAMFAAMAKGVFGGGGGVRGLAAGAVRMTSRLAMLLPPARAPFDEARREVEAMLGEFSDRLERGAFLLGDEPTLADVAAVGLTLHLKYPESRHLAVPELAGRGVTELVESPRCRRFFAWRDVFYREILR